MWKGHNVHYQVLKGNHQNVLEKQEWERETKGPDKGKGGTTRRKKEETSMAMIL